MNLKKKIMVTTFTKEVVNIRLFGDKDIYERRLNFLKLILWILSDENISINQIFGGYFL